MKTKQAALPATRRLTFSAPNREWGSFGPATPWTEASVQALVAAGGWFKGTETFESEATRALAMKLSRASAKAAAAVQA